jgi:hypothetical protein
VEQDGDKPGGLGWTARRRQLDFVARDTLGDDGCLSRVVRHLGDQAL